MSARPRDLLALTKPRIVVLVLVTVATGFVLASAHGVAWGALAVTLAGTALVAGGTNALNQVAERDVDARMARTRSRPLAAGRLAVGPARALAWSSSATGLALLWAVRPAAAVLAAATLVSYVYVYTPLKRRTTLATLVGAVPGALPIAGGWAAGGGGPGAEVAILLGIMFLWQLPHFLALAWIYREDYASAGLCMLSAEDPDGRATFRQAALYAVALLPVTLAPVALGRAGPVYFWGALALTAWLAGSAFGALRDPTLRRARRLFTVSIVQLPLVLTLLMADSIR